ncbi:MAG: hypothetical protein JRE82_05165 [Deltaproteobacteria bacterium]|nr:hypothetical protein [Deltaproteobacteria bacterium]
MAHIRFPHLRGWIVGICVLGALGCTTTNDAPNGTVPDDPIPEPASGHPGFASPQVQSIALSPTGRELYVTNTPADTLDIIDAETREIVYRVATGIDPVSVAVRPDGLEVWVSNHISDSVTIIDVDPTSPTRYRVVGTIQAYDEEGMVTDFDEPSGIAFANDDKAYVALSSRNFIAVVDVASRTVTNQIKVNAQEPRALTVRDGRLYVLPFESGNQTELSGCFANSSNPDCTFDIPQVLFANNLDAILTRNFVANIIRNSGFPDRDLFVYDTENDTLLREVSTIGTLLYGVAVDSQGRVFISQAEARNDANGLAGTEGHDLIDLENRAFLNQIARLDCGDECGALELIELEPELPAQPAAGMALATPYGIQISDDDSTIVAVAAGSSRLFTMNAATGEVLGRLAVGAIPKALVLESGADGAPSQAWVYNAIENSVSLVDVSDPANPSEIERIVLDDPTHPEVKKGRIAFNNADGSTSGTFSCESCHPDGNTDQLLWNLGAICITEGCDQTQPRTTMPVRGLRDTLPLHWDGVPGDPFGGINAELTGQSGMLAEPNCTDEHSCFRDLVNGAMGGTMCDLNACPTDENEEGLAGALNEEDRDAMATFLMSVPFPPARDRRLDDQLSEAAFTGFKNFTVGSVPENGGCSRAGVCHSAPFWTNTNTPGTGFEAPTFRGLNDRHLLMPNGRGGMWELLRLDNLNPAEHDPMNGPDEYYAWAMTFGTEEFPIVNRSFGFGPFEIFQFFSEGSTGFSGTIGRQVTLDATTTTDSRAAATNALLDQLEASDENGAVDLRANGARLADGEELLLIYDGGTYYYVDGDGVTSEGLTRAELIEAARNAELTATITARHGINGDVEHPQPGIWLPAVPADISPTANLQAFPDLTDDPSFTMFGRHIEDGAILIVDGRRVEATVSCEAGGSLPCNDEVLRVEMAQMPSVGDHTFMVVTPNGMVSNELLMFVR